jgi:NADH dehydrogenase FAD-containing subunit
MQNTAYKGSVQHTAGAVFMDEENLPTVVLGAGFTGLCATLHLCHHRYPHPIVLIDQAERFVFKPLLYELISGEMTDTQVQPRYTELFECDSVKFVQGNIQSIDLPNRRVILTSGLYYRYRNLILGLGSVTNFLGTPGAEEFAFPFRTGEDAITLRRHIRECFQCASQAQDMSHRQRFLTIAIIGAGPAGVEMAATLADLLPQWYDRLGGDSAEIRIVIFNRSSEILKGDINSHLKDTVHKALQSRTIPVELVLGAAVKSISINTVEYEQAGETKLLHANTVIWTAGTGLHPLMRVASTMQLPQFPEVFVGGDCAVLEEPLPATAQVAYQQGAMIAQNLIAIAQGHLPKPVTVTLRGTLMKLGVGEGVANLYDRLPITGRAGHLIRHGTYLELLPVYVHNFKATVGWLTDEIFQRHGRSGATPSSLPMPILKRLGDVAAILVVISSGLLFWRAVQPNSFKQTLQSTALPAFLDRLEQK